MQYTFRPCVLDDFDFLFILKKDNFRRYIEEIWGWNEEEQKNRLKEDLKIHLQHKKIILLDDKPIGIYVTHFTEDGDLYINEISILKEYQNKGIATKIISKQIKENKNKEIRTILQVFKNNPAKKLYERLGFRVYNETETHYQMENL